jgi:hypothetical protein
MPRVASHLYSPPIMPPAWEVSLHSYDGAPKDVPPRRVRR